jgi:hypothetical protein
MVKEFHSWFSDEVERLKDTVDEFSEENFTPDPSVKKVKPKPRTADEREEFRKTLLRDYEDYCQSLGIENI